jgi:hypothetical protein
MRIILKILCQIQRISPRLRYVNGGPGHIQCNNSCTYTGFNIQLNLSVLILQTCREFNAPYTANVVPNTAHIFQFTLSELWSGHIQCKYNSAYSAFNIQLNVSALILEICRQFNAPYNAIFVPNKAHILQITLCELWSRTYTM